MRDMTVEHKPVFVMGCWTKDIILIYKSCSMKYMYCRVTITA